MQRIIELIVSVTIYERNACGPAGISETALRLQRVSSIHTADRIDMPSQRCRSPLSSYSTDIMLLLLFYSNVFSWITIVKSYLKLLKVINRNIGEDEFGGEMMEQFGGRCRLLSLRVRCTQRGEIHTALNLWLVYDFTGYYILKTKLSILCVALNNNIYKTYDPMWGDQKFF